MNLRLSKKMKKRTELIIIIFIPLFLGLFKFQNYLNNLYKSPIYIPFLKIENAKNELEVLINDYLIIKHKFPETPKDILYYSNNPSSNSAITSRDFENYFSTKNKALLQHLGEPLKLKQINYPLPKKHNKFYEIKKNQGLSLVYFIDKDSKIFHYEIYLINNKGEFFYTKTKDGKEYIFSHNGN